MKILLVDDDYLLAKGTAKLIERLSEYTVALADEPAEIFRLCQSGDVDIVLMDVNLPGAYLGDEEVSGTDLARLLKTDPKTAYIPIVLLTAYALLSERKTLLEDSMADNLYTKPVTNYEELLSLITQLYEASQQQRQL
ncbi:MAG: response regulator [Coleofasciculaceae cyanobacterium]